MASVRRLPLVRLARLRQNTNLDTRLDFTEFSNGGFGRNRGFGGIMWMAESDSGAEAKKASARLSSMRQVLHEAEELSAMAADSGPTPKVTLDHVTVSFARSGGAGRQNVNELNTKVDMRFNVNKAYWLCERIRENILQMENNKINKDGELAISSTKTRTQKGNIDDALEKIQAIIDAASYVPPPPSEEQKKRIEILSAISEWKRLDAKKINSKKKISRRNCQNLI